MKKFEYDTILIGGGDSVTVALNEMGKKGWEAFDIHRNFGDTIVTLKREMPIEVKNIFEDVLDPLRHNHNPDITLCKEDCPCYGADRETGMVEG